MKRTHMAALTIFLAASLLSQSAAAQSAASGGSTQNSYRAAVTGPNAVEAHTATISSPEIEALRLRIEILENRN
jgi:hypothetical protein